MGGRVGVSILTTLGLPELVAEDDAEYSKIAIRLGKNQTYYTSIRSRLVHTCLQKPSNPYWDMSGYVRNLERGFQAIWNLFISGGGFRNVIVKETKRLDGRTDVN